MDIMLAYKNIEMGISCQGGAIVRASMAGLPLLRDCDELDFNIFKTSSFPLIPFANRISHNSFKYNNKTYALTKNTLWDNHCLHGDAWLLSWDIVYQSKNELCIEMRHLGQEGQPFDYIARQIYSISDDGVISIRLYIENTGTEELPFGTGHHFYFPLTKDTTLQAGHGQYWSEREDYLPGTLGEAPSHLDFTSPNPIPRQWINNAYEDWNGEAYITWPERGLGAQISADSIFQRFFIFHSSVNFEPKFRDDYFCFEPMSHTPNAHNLIGNWGLIPLQPKQSIGANIHIKPYKI